ncbi:putative kelch-type beta propeller [Helianthus anomalus]
MGKKTRKPGKGKEKTERKTAKAEEKKPTGSPRESHLKMILILFCINPLKETEMILYGGEFYNGTKVCIAVLFLNRVMRYDAFSGEFTSPNQERFHHYKVLYKHKLVVFGGSYDTLGEVRYFNDLYVFDLDKHKLIKKIKNEETHAPSNTSDDPMEVVTNDEDENMDRDIGDISSSMEKNVRVNGAEVAVESNSKTHDSNSKVLTSCSTLEKAKLKFKKNIHVYFFLL